MKVCPQCGSEYELDQRFCPKDGSALRGPAASSDLLGQIIAERYHVLKKLGEGGMGQVYLAEHVKMGRKSAVKVMHPSMNSDADAVSRFNREASNASRINHPNVCAIYDFGETPEGLIYLSMEFIEGESLTSLIESQGALVPARAADIARQTAEALNVAHDFGIVHRDLKPDNIMITRTREGTDLVKVVDFGIAKAGASENQKVTKTGMVVGTPEYMSPEQLAGDKLDGRSDIYSLGLVTFNMLTGTLPFASESAQEAMIMRLTDRPRTLAEVKPEKSWPDDLQAVMDKVLARDARERYATAGEFARDLVRAIERMPQTQVIEAGTQVLSAPAVPATRVAAAADRPDVKTAVVAAPPVAGRAPAAPAAAAGTGEPAKKSAMPMIIGAVVLVGIAGGAFAMKGGGTKAPDTTTAPPAASTPAASTPAASTPAASTPPTVTAANPPATVPPAGTTAPTPDAGASTAPSGGKSTDASAELQRLVVLVEADDKAKTKEALAKITAMKNLSGSNAVVGQYVRAAALYQTGKEAQGCAILTDIRGKAAAAGLGDKVEVFFGSGACKGS